MLVLEKEIAPNTAIEVIDTNDGKEILVKYKHRVFEAIWFIEMMAFLSVCLTAEGPVIFSFIIFLILVALCSRWLWRKIHTSRYIILRQNQLMVGEKVGDIPKDDRKEYSLDKLSNIRLDTHRYFYKMKRYSYKIVFDYLNETKILIKDLSQKQAEFLMSDVLAKSPVTQRFLPNSYTPHPTMKISTSKQVISISTRRILSSAANVIGTIIILVMIWAFFHVPVTSNGGARVGPLFFIMITSMFLYLIFTWSKDDLDDMQ